MLNTAYCSQAAQAADDPLYGTASTAKVWLILEYSGYWREEAITDNDLPAHIQSWLDTQSAAIPQSRVLFIKRERHDKALSFYVAITRAVRQRVYHFTLSSYDDLLNIDVAAIANGSSDVKASDEKLILVCTNGKRDRCCAKFGTPVYNALRVEEGLSVWQSTHLGGHRYAATAAVFPAGVYYGYLAPNAITDLAEAVRNDTLNLPNYRGRTYYDGVVSAADFFLRRVTHRYEASAYTLEGALREGNSWRVVLRDHSVTYVVTLDQVTTEPKLASCDKPPKPQTEFVFDSVEVQTIG